MKQTNKQQTGKGVISIELIITTFLCILFVAPMISAGEINLNFPENISEGETFTINITGENLSNLIAYQISYFYDNDFLEFISMSSENNILLGQVFTAKFSQKNLPTNTSEDSVITLAVASSDAFNSFSGNGILGSFTFKAIKDGNTSFISADQNVTMDNKTFIYKNKLCWNGGCEIVRQNYSLTISNTQENSETPNNETITDEPIIEIDNVVQNLTEEEETEEEIIPAPTPSSSGGGSRHRDSPAFIPPANITKQNTTENKTEETIDLNGKGITGKTIEDGEISTKAKVIVTAGIILLFGALIYFAFKIGGRKE